MRTGLERNKRIFHYALYTGEEEIRDGFGDYTGDTRPTYSEPVEFRANISPASGSTVQELFGVISDYDRVIGPLPGDIPIDENSVIWISKPTTGPHDYVVKRRADGINHVMILVSRVEVS